MADGESKGERLDRELMELLQELRVRIGNQMALWGTVFLAAAIVLALYVVTNVLFTSELALATAIAAVLVFAGVWYVLPMTGRPSGDEGPEDRAGSPDIQAQESRGASS